MKTLALTELLQLLGDTEKSGCLSCWSATVSKCIYLENGIVVAADSNDPNEMLGHFLISRGAVTEEHVREGLRLQEQTKRFIGETLIELGAIERAALESALLEKTEEIIYSLFDWQRGSFQFERGQVPIEESLTPIRLLVTEVLMKWAARHDELRRIREILPAGEVIPKLLQDPPATALRTPLAQRMYPLVDGSRSFAAIQLAAHSTEYEVGRQLYSWYVDGCLAILPPVREVVAEPAQPELASITEALERADSLYQQGNLAEALDIYRAALEMGSERADLRQLAAGTEEALVEEIYAKLPRKTVLQKTLDSQQLMASSFTPEQFFLIDRVNGAWTVKDLVRLSPLPEVDSLRMLLALVDRRVLKVQERF